MSNILKYGVDISEHQGNFDFTPYKDHFVILRCAWGENTDAQFYNNVAKCKALGIPVGVYIYSYALNTDQAYAEARYVIDLIKSSGVDIKYGVWYDMEDADNYKARNGIIGNNDLLSEFCKIFCSQLQNAGYYTGVYASQSWFDSKLYGIDAYDKWVASWGTNDGSVQRDGSGYGGMLQFTSKYKGYLDGNVAYYDYPALNGGNPSVTPEPSLKSVSEVASEVWAGLWGDGDDRYNRLTSAGYNYDEVQAEVDRTNPHVGGSLEVGSTVVVTNPVDVNGTSITLWHDYYSIIEFQNNGTVAVIGVDGVITCAISVDNIKLA